MWQDGAKQEVRIDPVLEVSWYSCLSSIAQRNV